MTLKELALKQRQEDEERFLAMPHDKLAKLAAGLNDEIIRIGPCPCCRRSARRDDAIKYGMCGNCEFG